MSHQITYYRNEQEFERGVRLSLGWVDELSSKRTRKEPQPKENFTIAELAEKWGYSRGNVYNILRNYGANVLDFSKQGRKSSRRIPAKLVYEIEKRNTKRFR